MSVEATPNQAPSIDAGPPPVPKRGTLLPSREEIDRMWFIAQTVASGSNLPKGVRNAGGVFSKILMGWEHGIGAMAALHEIDVQSDGKMSLPARVKVGLIQSRGIGTIEVTTLTDQVAAVRVRRSDWPDGRTETIAYTAEDAVRGELLVSDGKGGYTSRKDNWRKTPKAMLLARAREDACRQYFPELFMGMPYSADELGADTDEDGQPIALPEPPHAHVPGLTPPTLAPAPSPTESTTEQPSSLRTPVGPAATPATNLTGSVAQVPAGPPATVSPTSSSSGISASDWQLGRIRELVGLLKPDRAGWDRVIARYGAAKIAELTVAQADDVITFLDSLRIIGVCKQWAGGKGMSEVDWAKCLARRGVSQAIELKPDQAKEIADKLWAMVTPFKRQELGLEPKPAGALAGNPSTEAQAPAPSLTPAGPLASAA